MKCKSKTKNGSPCNRETLEISGYCYSHIHGIFNKFTYFLAELLGTKRKFIV